MLSKKDRAIKEGINNQLIIDRFFSNISYQDNGCYMWTACSSYKKDGYAGFYIYQDGKTIVVKGHRFAYALLHGFDALPKGPQSLTHDAKVLNHICFNRMCVNPNHLTILTNSENTILKNRKPRNSNDAIHAYSEESFMAKLDGGSNV